MRRVTITVFFGLLVGCTTTEGASNYLNQKYVGRNADEFFIEYGMPADTFELKDGRRLYSWKSKSVHVKGLACNLELRTDTSGLIQNIDIKRDTNGVWQTSQCSEYFVKSDLQMPYQSQVTTSQR